MTHVPQAAAPTGVVDSSMMREIWSELDAVELSVGLDPSLTPFPFRPKYRPGGVIGPRSGTPEAQRLALVARDRYIAGRSVTDEVMEAKALKPRQKYEDFLKSQNDIKEAVLNLDHGLRVRTLHPDCKCQKCFSVQLDGRARNIMQAKLQCS